MQGMGEAAAVAGLTNISKTLNYILHICKPTNIQSTGENICPFVSTHSAVTVGIDMRWWKEGSWRNTNTQGLPVLSVIHTGSIWDERAMRETRVEKNQVNLIWLPFDCQPVVCNWAYRTMSPRSHSANRTVQPSLAQSSDPLVSNFTLQLLRYSANEVTFKRSSWAYSQQQIWFLLASHKDWKQLA